LVVRGLSRVANFLRVFERAAIGEIGCNPVCTKRVAADRRIDADSRRIISQASHWFIGSSQGPEVRHPCARARGAEQPTPCGPRRCRRPRRGNPAGTRRMAPAQIERAALGSCDLSILHVGGEWQWLVRQAGRDVVEALNSCAAPA
jgi:hypothetical protein